MKSAPVTAQHVIFLTKVRVRNQLAGRVARSQCATIYTEMKMWDLEVLVRDSGISVVFAGYSSKKRDSW